MVNIDELIQLLDETDVMIDDKGSAEQKERSSTHMFRAYEILDEFYKVLGAHREKHGDRSEQVPLEVDHLLKELTTIKEDMEDMLIAMLSA